MRENELVISAWGPDQSRISSGFFGFCGYLLVVHGLWFDLINDYTMRFERTCTTIERVADVEGAEILKAGIERLRPIRKVTTRQYIFATLVTPL